MHSVQYGMCIVGTVEIEALVGTSERASLHGPIFLRLLLAYALYIFIIQ